MNESIKKINYFPDYSPIKIYLSIISSCKLQNKDIISSFHILKSINELKYSAPKVFIALTNSNNIQDKISIKKTENALLMLNSLKLIDMLEIQDHDFAINILIDKKTANDFLDTVNENLRQDIEKITNNLPQTLEKGASKNELF